MSFEVKRKDRQRNREKDTEREREREREREGETKRSSRKYAENTVTGHTLGAVPGWSPLAETKRNGNTSPLLQVFRIDSSASTRHPFPPPPFFRPRRASSPRGWCDVQ